MTGRVAVIGLGPGDDRYLTRELRTTYEADAAGIDADQLISRLLETVPVP
jgi:hypothetical protein